MKKTTLLISTFGFLINSGIVFAEDVKIKTPNVGVDATLGVIIGNMITIVIVIAALAVLFMLIFGAFEWITSGGDKEAIAKARGRIINALIGLVIIAVAFVIIKVVGSIVNIDVQNLSLPNLDS